MKSIFKIFDYSSYVAVPVANNTLIMQGISFFYCCNFTSCSI